MREPKRKRKRARTRITILSNVRCRAVCSSIQVAEYLDESLAEEKPGAEWDPRHRRFGGMLDGKRHHFYRSDKSTPYGTFPRGLLERVKQLLKDSGHRYSIEDLRKPPPEPDLSCISPTMLKGVRLEGAYSYQLPLVAKAIEAQSGILWLATNAGKTEIASAMIKVLMKHHTILFVVPKRTLLKQTRERIAERLGTVPEEIGVIGGGRFEPAAITVAIVNSVTPKNAKAKATRHRNEILKRYLKEVEVVFLDEGHHAKATTWTKLMKAMPNAWYRYIMSGTPFGGGNELLVEAQAGPVIARVKNQKLIELGVSAKPKVRIININRPSFKDSDDQSWATVYEEGITHNDYRNDIIAAEVKKLMAQRKSVLVMIRHLAHGDALMQRLKGQRHVYYVHGQMPTEMVEEYKELFASRRGSGLIASSIFDEGVDIPSIDAMIIADGGKSLRAVLQKVGRGLRKKKEGDNVVEVIDFADDTHKYLAKHSLERYDIYEMEEFDVTEEDPGTSRATAGRVEEESEEDLSTLLRESVRKGEIHWAPRTAGSVSGPTEERATSLSQSSAVMRWHWRVASGLHRSAVR